MYEIAKSTPVSLKKHAQLNEKWLQDQISDDPGMLGLGDLTIVKLEKSVPGGGRIDMILSDDDSSRRFEVELMLGATDSSHIVRTIEYWDIERRRYPGHDHVAVLVAEDITARFLNVLSLMAGSIPLIALQLTVLEVDDKLVLHFVRVLDQTDLRMDDDDESSGGGEVQRQYWDQKAPKQLMSMCDAMVKVLDEVSPSQFEMKFQKNYIGLRRDGVVDNILTFTPKPTKGYVHVGFRNIDGKSWKEKFMTEGVPVQSNHAHRMKLTLTSAEWQKHRSLIEEAIREAADADEPE